MSRVAIANYDKAVKQLSAASHGLYAGPRYSIQTLEKAIGTTAGLNTKAIRDAAKNATGKGVSIQRLSPVVLFLLKLLEGIAISLIATFLAGQIEDLFRRWRTGSDLVEETERAMGDIDKMGGDASAAMEDASIRTLNLMEQVVQLLAAALQHPDKAFAQQFVDIGAELIDTLAEFLLNTSKDRDEGIGFCFDNLCSSAEALQGTHNTENAPDAQGTQMKAAAEIVLTDPASALVGETPAAVPPPVIPSSADTLVESISSFSPSPTSALSWSPPPTLAPISPVMAEVTHPGVVAKPGLATQAPHVEQQPVEYATTAEQSLGEDPLGDAVGGQALTPSAVPILAPSAFGLALAVVGIGMVVDFLHTEVKKTVEQYFAFLAPPADIIVDAPAEVPLDTVPVDQSVASPEPAPVNAAEPTPASRETDTGAPAAAPAAGSDPTPALTPKPVPQVPAEPAPASAPGPAPMVPSPPIKSNAAPPPPVVVPPGPTPNEPVQKSHLRRAGAW